MAKDGQSPDAGLNQGKDAGRPKDREAPGGVSAGPKDAGLSGSVAHANKNLRNKTLKGAVDPCQKEKDKIELVELVEIVKRTDEGVVVGAAPESKKLKKVATRTDKSDDGSYKQYINIDKDVDGASKRHPEYGDYIELRARVKWVSGDKGLTGGKVYWKFKLEAGDGRPPSKPAETVGFWGLAEWVSSTDRDGWTEAVQFYFTKHVDSSYAGDKFTIFLRQMRIAQASRRVRCCKQDPIRCGGSLGMR